MAEREGFEPPIELPLCRISSAVLSTTQPSLRIERPAPPPKGQLVERAALWHSMRRLATALAAPLPMRSVPLFVYGTLRDPDLRRAVLGRGDAPGTVVPARLIGFRAAKLPARTYPGLVASRRHSVAGALIHGLTDLDREALAAYEGPEYRLVRIPAQIKGRPTLLDIYVTWERPSALLPSWSLLRWRREHKTQALELLEADHVPVGR